MKTKLPIYALCFVNLIYLVPSVAVSGLVAAFPGVPEERLLLLLTIPNLAGIAGILGVPVLTRWCSRRDLSAAAMALFLLGGGMSLVFHGCLPVLLLGSAVMGVAYGVNSAVYPLLVSMYYQGEERSRMSGVASGMLQLGRVSVVLVGGVLADLCWYSVYLLFALAAVPLVLTLAWLPKDRPAAREESSAGVTDGWDRAALVRLCAIGFAFAVCYYVNVTHTSLYIEGGGFGTAAVTGAVTAAASVLSGLLAICFGPIYRRTGRYTFALALAIMGGTYVLAGLWVNLATAVLAVCGAAVGIALFSPCLMLEMAGAAPQRTLPAATALVLTIVNVGYFLSPVLVGAVSGLTAGSTPAEQFLTGGVLALLITAACLLLERRSGTK